MSGGSLLFTCFKTQTALQTECLLWLTGVSDSTRCWSDLGSDVSHHDQALRPLIFVVDAELCFCQRQIFKRECEGEGELFRKFSRQKLKFWWRRATTFHPDRTRKNICAKEGAELHYLAPLSPSPLLPQPQLCSLLVGSLSAPPPLPPRCRLLWLLLTENRLGRAAFYSLDVWEVHRNRNVSSGSRRPRRQKHAVKRRISCWCHL